MLLTQFAAAVPQAPQCHAGCQLCGILGRFPHQVSCEQFTPDARHGLLRCVVVITERVEDLRRSDEISDAHLLDAGISVVAIICTACTFVPALPVQRSQNSKSDRTRQEVARLPGRSPSGISREIRRNMWFPSNESES